MISELTLTETQLMTGEELAAMGSLGRCELIEGRIVPMSPTGDEHGGIEIRLGGKLDNFSSTHNLLSLIHI